jgi:hypothetical protein
MVAPSALGARIDTAAAPAAWETALASQWRGSPVWVHGDIACGNLPVAGGTLCAAVDYGSSAVGDPARDPAIARTLFAAKSRQGFRAALPLDDATRARGRGRALWNQPPPHPLNDRALADQLGRRVLPVQYLRLSPVPVDGSTVPGWVAGLHEQLSLSWCNGSQTLRHLSMPPMGDRAGDRNGCEIASTHCFGARSDRWWLHVLRVEQQF